MFDGPSRKDLVLGTYCSNELPAPVISTGNTMLVVMRTDSMISSKGFKAEYSIACGARIVANATGTFNGDTIVSIPSWTGLINCTWVVLASDPGEIDQ